MCKKLKAVYIYILKTINKEVPWGFFHSDNLFGRYIVNYKVCCKYFAYNIKGSFVLANEPKELLKKKSL